MQTNGVGVETPVGRVHARRRSSLGATCCHEMCGPDVDEGVSANRKRNGCKWWKIVLMVI